MSKLNNAFTIKEYEQRVFYIIYILINSLYERKVNITDYNHDYYEIVKAVKYKENLDINFQIRENSSLLHSNIPGLLPKIKSAYIGRLNKEYIFCDNYQSMISYKFPAIWLFEDFEEDLAKSIILGHL